MCDKGDWAADIRPGTSFSGFFLVRRCRQDVTLMDASGSIVLKPAPDTQLEGAGPVWISANQALPDRASAITAIPVSQWTGNPFALIESELPGHVAAKALHDHVERIQSPAIKHLIHRFFSDRTTLRAFMTAPASLRHHHAWPGGLAVHTLETTEMAVRAASCCLDGTSTDLVRAACLLHDAGKAFEYVGGTRLSHRGRLLGHEITLLEMLASHLDDVWERGHPQRLMLLHLLTAKPAPRWTGIRHPRTRLVSIVRFADQWSANQPQAKGYREPPGSTVDQRSSRTGT